LDAEAKVRGRARYTADLYLPGMLTAVTVRSPYPHARIREIDTSGALAVPGVRAALSAGDIPGANRIGPVVKDQPILADEKVRFVGEPVVIVAADTREAAEEGAARVMVAYDPLPAVTDTAAALQPDAPLIHPEGNVARRTRLRRGNIAAGFAVAEVVAERTFVTQMVEHAYLEPEAAVAAVEPDGRVTVWASTQYVHFDRDEIARMLGVPSNRVRVIQMMLGGGFGGKFGCPLPQCHAALLAVRTGRPVKLVYSRTESIAATVKRHPFWMHFRIGATREGRFVALEADLRSDTGAYLVTGNAVIGRATTHATGPYMIPHVRVDGCAVFTNNPPAGAMRGYGVPQVTVAIETLVDDIAHQLGLDPLELRLRNALQAGSATATGQVLLQSVGISEVLRRAGEAAQRFRSEIAAAPPGRRRGVGLAACLHGVGSSRKPSQSVAIVHVAKDGSVGVITGSVEIGQGSNTVLAQIVAEELRVPLEYVTISNTDSSVAPDCEATTGSRVTYITGNAVWRAAAGARKQILALAAEQFGVDPGDLVLTRGVVLVRSDPSRQIGIGDLLSSCGLQGISAMGSFMPDTTPLDAEAMQGVPHAAYSFGAHAALVEVDVETGRVTVLRYASFSDVGRAINPAAVEGQAHGGAAMGLGFALWEEVRLDGGRVLNPSFASYTLPTARDVPDVEVGIVEAPESSGPFGAKAVGEMVTNPVAPAILSALRNAAGIVVTRLPASPERVYDCLRQLKGTDRGQLCRRL